MTDFVASVGGIMVPIDVHAETKGSGKGRDDSVNPLLDRHRKLVEHANLHFLMQKLDENKDPPRTFILTCTDYRISASDFFNLPPGKAFIQKQVGGFLTRDLGGAAAFHASLAVAMGIKAVEDIFLMTHSDCAAAKIAVQFPEHGMITEAEEKSADKRTIQRSVLGVSDKVPYLSRIFRMMQSRGHPLPAEDLMAAHLGIESYNNLMQSKLFCNQTRTTREMVDMGKVRVTLLHLDLGQKSSIDPDKYMRMPALYKYDPTTGQFCMSKRYDDVDFKGMEFGCDCHDITPAEGAAADVSPHLQIPFGYRLLAP